MTPEAIAENESAHPGYWCWKCADKRGYPIPIHWHASWSNCLKPEEQ